ncbi:MAG: hypothetical protein JXR78_00280 [Victivallales bacterium]|nr:hypothetical protein [Victivallales bacterium]
MKISILNTITQTCLAIALLGGFSTSLSAATEKVLFEEDLSTGNTINWSEFVPGTKRKCKLRVSMVKNDGESNQALRVQLGGLSAAWAGIAAEAFTIDAPGTVTISFMVKAKKGTKGKIIMAGPGRKKWSAEHAFDIGPEYRKIEYSAEYDAEAFKRGQKINLKLLLKNNSDVFFKDIKVVRK